MPLGRSFVLLLAWAPLVLSADWPQWRGVHRDGVAMEAGLLKTWPAAGPPLLWEAKGAGRGYSSIVVAAASRSSSSPRHGLTTAKGNPVVTQCAAHFARTASSSGSGDSAIRSRLPSS